MRLLHDCLMFVSLKWNWVQISTWPAIDNSIPACLTLYAHQVNRVNSIVIQHSVCSISNMQESSHIIRCCPPPQKYHLVKVDKFINVSPRKRPVPWHKASHPHKSAKLGGNSSGKKTISIWIPVGNNTKCGKVQGGYSCKALYYFDAQTSKIAWKLKSR